MQRRQRLNALNWCVHIQWGPKLWTLKLKSLRIQKMKLKCHSERGGAQMVRETLKLWRNWIRSIQSTIRQTQSGRYIRFSSQRDRKATSSQKHNFLNKQRKSPISSRPVRTGLFFPTAPVGSPLLADMFLCERFKRIPFLKSAADPFISDVYYKSHPSMVHQGFSSAGS